MKIVNNIIEAKLKITGINPKNNCKCEYNIYLYSKESDSKILKRQEMIIKKLRIKCKKFRKYHEEIEII